MALPPLGTDLHAIRTQTFGMLLSVAEGVQLAAEAISLVANKVSESSQDRFTFQYPIGFDAAGSILPSRPREWKREELHRRYLGMRELDLPLTAIYQLVTITEAWIGHVLRRVLRQFPQKIGHKRQISASLVLSAPTLEAAQITATNAFLHELSYKSPREYGEIASSILSIELADIPAFSRYCEVKATRDIWIHNLGIANEIYCQKAGSHARVQATQFLPVNMVYFLNSYEATLQLLEQLHTQLEQLWPPPAEQAAPLFDNDTGATSVSGSA